MDTDNETIVEKNYLNAALQSIQLHRRYWHASIPRVLTSTLARKLEEAGYPVIVREMQPIWEHLFFLAEDASPENDELIESIVQLRDALGRSGSNSPLPI
jgi:hypothetical protein